MDPISMVIGVAGLTGVFTACVDGFNYFADAKSFRKDSQLLINRFELIELRFLAWGYSVGFQAGSEPGISADVHGKIKNSLQSIDTLLKDARKTSEKYLSRDETSTELVSEPTDLSTLFKARLVIREKCKKLAPLYRGFGSIQKGFIWAIHDKDSFEGLLDQLTSFVGNLERLCKLLAKKATREYNTDEVLRSEIISIEEVDALEGIKEAASEFDTTVEDAAIERLAEVTGTTSYEKLDFKDNAETQVGDIVFAGTTYNRNANYRDITAGGKSRTHLGSVFGLKQGDPSPSFSSPVFKKDFLDHLDRDDFPGDIVRKR
jgi:hypothetical protein